MIPFQEGFVFVEVAPPLDRIHEGELTEEWNGAGTADVLQDSQLVVGQPPVLLPQPAVQDLVCRLHSELVQAEDVLTAVGESPEVVLLLPGLEAVLLLLLEGDDDLAELGQRIGQPRASVPVLINVENLEVVEQYQNRVSHRGQVEDLLEVGFEGDEVVGDVVVGQVQVVADLLADRKKKRLERRYSQTLWQKGAL